MAIIQTEVEPEAIIDAMNEDGDFAATLWFEIAEKLHMGLLLDNACDLFSSDVGKAKFIADQFELLATAIRSRHDELTED